MQDIRLSIEQLTNSNLDLRLEINNLKVEIVRLLADSKVERSDRLLTTTEAKKKMGANDAKWAQLLRDPTFPRTQLTEGSNLKFSDKALDAWIADNLIKK